jgi:hypothetical protein
LASVYCESELRYDHHCLDGGLPNHSSAEAKEMTAKRRVSADSQASAKASASCELEKQNTTKSLSSRRREYVRASSIGHRQHKKYHLAVHGGPHLFGRDRHIPEMSRALGRWPSQKKETQERPVVPWHPWKCPIEDRDGCPGFGRVGVASPLTIRLPDRFLA